MIVSTQTDGEELQMQHQRALHVFHEMLTATSPDVREALESLYELVRAEIKLAQCQCHTHSPQTTA